jgi:hypothetical protein
MFHSRFRGTRSIPPSPKGPQTVTVRSCQGLVTLRTVSGDLTKGTRDVCSGAPSPAQRMRAETDRAIREALVAHTAVMMFTVGPEN